jgi:hypothetical protein
MNHISTVRIRNKLTKAWIHIVVSHTITTFRSLLLDCQGRPRYKRAKFKSTLPLQVQFGIQTFHSIGFLNHSITRAERNKLRL